MVKVSIVIPVYNAERYLEQCLQSLRVQTLQDIEIICVNDGSTDASLEVLQRQAEQDLRIHILDKANAGAGPARNDGMALASGKYLLFLDADDYFAPELVQRMWEQAERFEADICACRAWTVNNDGRLASLNYDHNFFRANKDECFSAASIGEHAFQSLGVEPWNKLYRRSFIAKLGLQFQELQRSNDIFFTAVSVIHARRIALVDEELVFYRIYNRKKYNQKGEPCLLNFYEALREIYVYMQREGFWQTFAIAYYRYATMVIFYNLHILHNREAKEEVRDFLRSEGLAQLGLVDMEASPHLSWIDRHQYRILRYPHYEKQQDMCYLASKILFYYHKQGVCSLIKKCFYS